MNIYESAEDYLERILILRKNNGRVISIDIANSMNYSKASVSRAMKNLRENGYIEVDANGHITLTDLGEEIAVKIYERHHLLTDFFVMLGVDKKIAQQDACKIEHDISNETFEAIKYHVIEKKCKILIVSGS